jgi:hypothetical protein
MKKNYSHVTIVLDRSGSMSSVKDDTIGGFNEFIEKQKEDSGECTFSMVQFDDQYEILHEFKSIKKVSKLTDKTFSPRGSTALFDAIGKTVNSVGTVLSNMKEEDRPERVIFVVITDGYENASKEFTSGDVNKMITHQTEKYNWQFMFLGANQDAILAAGELGIKAGNSLSYAATGVGVRALFSLNLSEAVSNYKNMDYSCYTSTTTSAFTEEDRKMQEELIKNQGLVNKSINLSEDNRTV